MTQSVSPVEVGLTVLVLAASTALATKMFVLSNKVTSSPITAILLVLVAIGVFSIYPAVGISILLFTAVLMFNRNVRNTMKMIARPRPMDTFQNVATMRTSDDMFQGQMNGPSHPDYTVANARPSNESLLNTVIANSPPIPRPSGPPDVPPAYRGTYGADSIMGENIPVASGAPEGPIRSGPRPYAEFDETNPSNPLLGPVKAVEGFEPAPFGAEEGEVPYGSYPKDQERAMSTGEKREFRYRPEDDTGSNDFKRFGPNLDEKTESFKYYTD